MDFQKQMRLGRFEIGKWDYKEPEFIWFEYTSGYCGCRFLTICNILLVYYSKECLNEQNFDEKTD